jgi:hypothetical protein
MPKQRLLSGNIAQEKRIARQSAFPLLLLSL